MEPITKELRSHTKPFAANVSMLAITRQTFEWCCDSIDAVHANLERDVMPLPRDAEGVPVRVGDRMRCADGTTFAVSSVDYGLHPETGRDGEFWQVWDRHADYCEPADELTHAAETVETVLEDHERRSYDLIDMCAPDEDRERLRAKTARRLRDVMGA